MQGVQALAQGTQLGHYFTCSVEELSHCEQVISVHLRILNIMKILLVYFFCNLEENCFEG